MTGRGAGVIKSGRGVGAEKGVASLGWGQRRGWHPWGGGREGGGILGVGAAVRTIRSGEVQPSPTIAHYRPWGEGTLHSQYHRPYLHAGLNVIGTLDVGGGGPMTHVNFKKRSSRLSLK